MTRRFAVGPVAVLAAGLAGLLIAGVVACQAAPPESAGALPSFSAPVAASSGPVAASSGPAASSSGPAVSDGSLPTADGAEPPTQLLIPAMKLTATVDPVGVTGDVFDVPPSVDRVGWYKFGSSLADKSGSIVIAGHVDSAAQGRGAFFRLASLEPGDKVTVRSASGTVVAFKVAAREVYAKTKIPLDKYFARDGTLRLTLITCGGPFDRKTRHYRDNVVVTATPIPSTG